METRFDGISGIRCDDGGELLGCHISGSHWQEFVGKVEHLKIEDQKLFENQGMSVFNGTPNDGYNFNLDPRITKCTVRESVPHAGDPRADELRHVIECTL